MCKFSIGDKVRLKSDNESNTSMIVNNYLKDESKYKQAVLFKALSESDMKSIKCVWRDKLDVPHKEYYDEDILTKVE